MANHWLGLTIVPFQRPNAIPPVQLWLAQYDAGLPMPVIAVT